MPVLRFNHLRIHRKEVTEGHTDNMGDYVAGSEEWKDVCSADLEAQGGEAKIISYEDGRQVSYSHTVWLRDGSPSFSVGETVRVVDGKGEVLAEGTVKGFRRYQLTSKVYI